VTGTTGSTGATGPTGATGDTGPTPTLVNAYLYSNATQLAFPPPAFVNLTFSNTPTLNGVLFTAPSTITIPSAGLYLVQYNVHVFAFSGPSVASFHALLSGSEIPGSQFAVSMSSIGPPFRGSNSFMTQANANDTLVFQMASDPLNMVFIAQAGTGTVLPSITVTIVRIQ
jgi:hypothetical protein